MSNFFGRDSMGEPERLARTALARITDLGRRLGARIDALFTGDLQIGPDDSHVFWDESEHELRDDDGRQFVRSSSSRTAAQLIQYGTHTATTDGAGKLNITFPEAFTSTPVVIPTRVSTTSNQIVAHVFSVSTTGATFMCTSNDAAQISVSNVRVDWIAIGAKNDT